MPLAVLAALVLMTPAPALAGAAPFWSGWFVKERPVVYRPIVTPRTVYFQPAPVVEAPAFPPAPACPPPLRHRPRCR